MNGDIINYTEKYTENYTENYIERVGSDRKGYWKILK